MHVLEQDGDVARLVDELLRVDDVWSQTAVGQRELVPVARAVSRGDTPGRRELRNQGPAVAPAHRTHNNRAVPIVYEFDEL